MQLDFVLRFRIRKELLMLVLVNLERRFQE